MQQYLALLQHIKDKGNDRGDRTGTGTRSVFGYQMRFDLQDGFPLLTTKKLGLRLIIRELLWLLSGDTNIKYLTDNNVHIWDEWADENGDLGPVYGHQWRSWPGDMYLTRRDILAQDRLPKDAVYWADQDNSGVVGLKQTIDQISNVIARIKAKPEDRRLIVTAWNPADVEKMALPPCHCFFQFYTREISLDQRAIMYAKLGLAPSTSGLHGHDKYDYYGIPRRALDCQLYQRSCDSFLGLPFNIASYALLTMMVAQVCDMAPGEFVHTFGDVHIYNNHKNQTDLQLTREPRALPTMTLNPDVKNIFDFKFEDFTLSGYDAHPHIAGEVSV